MVFLSQLGSLLASAAGPKSSGVRGLCQTALLPWRPISMNTTASHWIPSSRPEPTCCWSSQGGCLVSGGEGPGSGFLGRGWLEKADYIGPRFGGGRMSKLELVQRRHSREIDNSAIHRLAGQRYCRTDWNWQVGGVGSGRAAVLAGAREDGSWRQGKGLGV